jgi:hypothetical protein
MRGIIRSKEKLEVIQTIPGASYYSLHNVKILEGYDNPKHWAVAENEEKEDTRQGN